MNTLVFTQGIDACRVLLASVAVYVPVIAL